MTTYISMYISLVYCILHVLQLASIHCSHDQAIHVHWPAYIWLYCFRSYLQGFIVFSVIVWVVVVLFDANEP